MNKNKKEFGRKMVVPTRRCSCGKELKQKSRTNHPFGINGASRRTNYFKCQNCKSRF